MGIPQLIMLVLMGAGLGGSLTHHGETKCDKYNFWVQLAAVAIEYGLLKWGGFF